MSDNTQDFRPMQARYLELEAELAEAKQHRDRHHEKRLELEAEVEKLRALKPTARLERAVKAEAKVEELHQRLKVQAIHYKDLEAKLAEVELTADDWKRKCDNVHEGRDRLRAELAEQQEEADAVIDSWRTQCIDLQAKLAEEAE